MSINRYEVSLYYYNEEQKTWIKSSTDIGETAVAFIESKGGLQFFKQAKAGDVFEFTESGVYKNIKGEHVNALSPEEIEKKFPDIQKVIDTAKYRAEQSGSQERVSTKELPTKADKIIIEVKVVAKEQKMLKEMQVTQTIANTNIPKSAQKPVHKKIAAGKAKQVFTRSDDPMNVYLTPVADVFETAFGSRETEIKGEVKTANLIKASLYKSRLLECLVQEKIAQPENVVEKIVFFFPTIEQFVEYLKANTGNQLSKRLSIDIETAHKIAEASKEIASIVKARENLAVDYEEVTEAEQIEGKYTVRAAIAARDLEKEIRTNPHTNEEKKELVLGAWAGQEQLHEAGYGHGDPKPENMLVYEDAQKNKIVKISDFGKAKELKGEEEAFYLGNARYIAPEKKMSKRAEVYSSALIAIRILEEGLLDPKTLMLTSPADIDTEVKVPETRRGVERFAVLSKYMPQTESTTLAGRVKAYVPDYLLPTYSVDVKKAERDIHSYIDALVDKLQAQGLDLQSANPLRALLKQMTMSDPSVRPTMNQARTSLEQIKF